MALTVRDPACPMRIAIEVVRGDSNAPVATADDVLYDRTLAAVHAVIARLGFSAVEELTYVDDEGDTITVQNEEEWGECWNVWAAEGAGVMKLRVHVGNADTIPPAVSPRVQHADPCVRGCEGEAPATPPPLDPARQVLLDAGLIDANDTGAFNAAREGFGELRETVVHAVCDGTSVTIARDGLSLSAFMDADDGFVGISIDDNATGSSWNAHDVTWDIAVVTDKNQVVARERGTLALGALRVTGRVGKYSARVLDGLLGGGAGTWHLVFRVCAVPIIIPEGFVSGGESLQGTPLSPALDSETSAVWRSRYQIDDDFDSYYPRTLSLDEEDEAVAGSDAHTNAGADGSALIRHLELDAAADAEWAARSSLGTGRCRRGFSAVDARDLMLERALTAVG